MISFIVEKTCEYNNKIYKVKFLFVFYLSGSEKCLVSQSTNLILNIIINIYFEY